MSSDSSGTRLRFLFALLGFVAAIGFAEARIGIHFETNDDVAMMMWAHGFGLAAVPTPMLFFSNLWQGYVVQALGWPFGYPGYGVYLLGALAVALAASFAFLAELSGRPLVALVVVAAVAVRPIFAPQFTVIAGFLAMASFLALLAYAARPRISVLIAAGLLGFAGFLMRDHLVMLALAVAAPLLLRRELVADKAVWVAAGGFGLLALLATLHHSAVLGGPEWALMMAQNRPRAAFTDFGLAPRVLASAEALAAAGWTANDVKLITLGWLADPVMASPEALHAAIATVGVQSLLAMNGERLGMLAQQFWGPSMQGALLLLLVGAFGLRGGGLWRFLAACGVLAGLAILVTALGRFGVSRIYFPALVAIVLLAIAQRPWSGSRATALGLAALAAGYVSLNYELRKASAYEARRPALEAGMERLNSKELHAVWADAIPFESIYRPLSHRDDIFSFRLYGIGMASFAPFSLARFGGDPMGLVHALQGPAGIAVLMRPENLGLLETYCAERWQGALEAEAVGAHEEFAEIRLRCRNPVP
ncbi:hypothetical protein [Roseococcus sp. YIM B11640]|uniref:hypothetical protein n=1 Tax=Roseococcus sp. YIM B11640 TaxID=3133973 RepID=UPI003C79C8C8